MPLMTLALLMQAASPTDTITVTATKTPTEIVDSAGSVSVLTVSDTGGLDGLSSAEELSERLAGVEAAVANGTQIAYQIRGIGAVDHQALTPGGAAVYSDGVFLATNVQTGFMLYDVERAEVLRGPQGTLYGRNASGGAINFLTIRPSADQPRAARLRAGSAGLVDLSGGWGTSFTDTIHGRIAVRRLVQDALLDNVVTDADYPPGPSSAGGERDEFGIRTSLLFDNANTDVLVRLHVEKDAGINPSPRNDGLELDGHDISIGPDGAQHTDSHFYGASVEVTSQWGDWSVYSLSAFEGYDQNYGFDFDGAQAPFGNPNLNANLSYDREFAQWSEEFRLNRSFGQHDLMLGATAAIDDFKQDYLIWCGTLDEKTLIGSCPYVGAPGRVGPDPASDGMPMSLLTRINQSRKTEALFARTDLAVSPKTRLILGARATHENIKGDGFGLHVFDDGITALNDRDGVGPAVGSNTIDDTRLTYNAALHRTLGQGWNAYGLLSTGYKSGGFNGEVQNNADHFADEGLFEAETVINYELGLKAQPTTGLRFNTALFHQLYDAPQARIFVAFPQPDGSVITSNSLSNLDEATSSGIEADLDWTASPRLNIRGGLTLLHTEISQTDEDVTISNSDLFDGNPLPFAPEVSATLSARYTHPLADQRSVVFDAHTKYRSEFYLDAEGRDDRRQGGYALLDASVRYALADQGVSIGLFGRNLTDEDYAVSGYGFIGYNTFRGAPRVVGVELSLSR
ncbi:TonB-dependent receptor [Parvularcula sp. LCG005]|uniref:TonB-dependent receptor n=1 Tax=Parvularcula sp. LCG005 TaxID=3078805 RepID=UPI0029433C57|nr:TonB-dependent receptor [Parvularcula sp. LCG005]WOI53527.1 TonB-dependent receptor [Parvularcula sp. LCG005]